MKCGRSYPHIPRWARCQSRQAKSFRVRDGRRGGLVLDRLNCREYVDFDHWPTYREISRGVTQSA